MSSLLSGLPPVTKYLMIFNVLVHITIFITSCPLNYFSINAEDIIQNHQVCRIVSAAFVHAGLFHIFMNMTSLVSLGSNLEMLLGSIQFLILSLYFVFVVGIYYLILSYVSFWITGDPSFLRSSGVGYSGVLFAYAMLEAFHTHETSRSVYGLFNVPAKVYPFILLVLIQLMMPNISLFGHLGGLLCGLSAVYGHLNWLNPSQEGYYTLDNSRFLSFLTSNRSFVRYSAHSPNIPSANSGSSGIFSGLFYIITSIWNILMALLFIIGCPTANINATIANYYNSAEEGVSSCCLSLKLKVQKFCCCLKMFRGMFGFRGGYDDMNDSDLDDNGQVIGAGVVGGGVGVSGSSSGAGGGSIGIGEIDSSSHHSSRGGVTNGPYHSVSTVDKDLESGIGVFKNSNSSSNYNSTSKTATTASTTNTNNSISSSKPTTFAPPSSQFSQLTPEELRKKRLEKLGGGNK